MGGYGLTLKKGKITYKNGIYKGSDDNASSWSPVDPDTQGGWEDGQTLTVTCTFDINPDVDPQPGPNEYAGLCVGACKAGTSEVTALINAAKSLGLPTVGKLLGSNITTSSAKTDDAIFYNAKSYKFARLKLHSGKYLQNYIHKWVMTYNGDNTVVSNGNEVEIVFGYGDPQEAQVVS